MDRSLIAHLPLILIFCLYHLTQRSSVARVCHSQASPLWSFGQSAEMMHQVFEKISVYTSVSEHQVGSHRRSIRRALSRFIGSFPRNGDMGFTRSKGGSYVSVVVRMFLTPYIFTCSGSLTLRLWDGWQFLMYTKVNHGYQSFSSKSPWGADGAGNCMHYTVGIITTASPLCALWAEIPPCWFRYWSTISHFPPL